MRIPLVRMAVACCALAGIVSACSRGITNPPGTPDAYGVALHGRVVADSLQMVLLNTGPSDVGYNLCLSDLESMAMDGAPVQWHDYVCTLPLFHLPPGDSTTYREVIPSSLASGWYRWRTGVLVAGVDDTVLSAPFLIR